VRHTGSLAVVLLALIPWSTVSAHPLRRFFELDRVNGRIAGQVLDYTHHHGSDRRIWSPALQQKRDLYVYLPPGFDPGRQYPLAVWLHGFAQDESTFLSDVIIPLDAAMREGRLPPIIIAAPDGSVRGVDCLLSSGSFFLNSEAGRFEDFLMIDVWNFLLDRFPIRPEREAHAILGVSMGAGAAFNKAIKFPHYFGIAVGLFPPLNLRWQDCYGRYRGNFDPLCWGWRTDFVHRRTVVARFYGIPIRMRKLLNPLYSRRNPETLPALIRNNPIEMLDLYDVQPGQLQMYVAYGGKDQFNIDAQVESFLFVAHQRGLEVGVGYDPEGKHNRATAEKLLSGILDWLAPRLALFAPDAPAPTPLIVPGPCGTLQSIGGVSPPLLP
jgi:S-formylglutathione hydrolase FrmB